MSVIGSSIEKGVEELVAGIFPAPCLGCGERLPPGRSFLCLCLACRGRLETPREACPRCGRLRCPGICGRCLERPPSAAGFAAAWVYRPPLDEVIRSFKFRGLDFLAEDLATGMAGCWTERVAGGCLDAVVPVPLHWRRRLTRGFNQADFLARPLARALGVPARSVLRRHRPTPPQASLGREARLVGPRNAFSVRRRQNVEGARILLVDDVATTGATLEAAARSLLDSGAAEVLAAVAARTP